MYVGKCIVARWVDLFTLIVSRYVIELLLLLLLLPNNSKRFSMYFYIHTIIKFFCYCHAYMSKNPQDGIRILNALDCICLSPIFVTVYVYCVHYNHNSYLHVVYYVFFRLCCEIEKYIWIWCWKYLNKKLRDDEKESEFLFCLFSNFSSTFFHSLSLSLSLLSWKLKSFLLFFPCAFYLIVELFCV